MSGQGYWIRHASILGAKALAQRVQWARSDIAEDDANGSQRQKPGIPGVRGMLVRRAIVRGRRNRIRLYRRGRCMADGRIHGLVRLPDIQDAKNRLRPLWLLKVIQDSGQDNTPQRLMEAPWLAVP